MFFLIAGLGNPGSAYRASRHNMGFRVADRLAERFDIAWGKKRFSAQFGAGSVLGQRVVLLKPQTYMNLSGESVAAASRFYKVEPERIVVIHDDIDLALGRIQVRRGGGHGGHRGVMSVAEKLGTPGFNRVRVGVGRPAAVDDVSDFVLEEFSEAEQREVDPAVDRAARSVETLIKDGLTTAMNRYNPWSAKDCEGKEIERKENDR